MDAMEERVCERGGEFRSMRKLALGWRNGGAGDSIDLFVLVILVT